MEKFFYYQILFFTKPYNLYTYRCNRQLERFYRVLVPFGKGQRLGLVYKQELTPSTDYAIKDIHQVVDEISIINDTTLMLLDFCHNYYGSALQDIIHTMIPARFKKEHPVDQDERLSLKGVCYPEHEKSLPALLPMQKSFVESIDFNRFHVSVLEGITGSGKTLCYQTLAKKCFSIGKNVLILIPEINLTTHLKQQFENCLYPVISYHSELTEKQRGDIFNDALLNSEQQRALYITTRSGVFLPIANIGLIVVDEEHDDSFKQSEGSFRYHGRDLAVKLAQLHGCPCVLGSATLSLQTLAHVESSYYSHYQLTERATAQRLPEVQFFRTAPSTWLEPLSIQLLKKIEQELARGKQILIYINKRGYIPNLYCTSCKQSMRCPGCLTRMIYHQKFNKLYCHYCGYDCKEPSSCQICHNPFIPVGFGTQRVQEYLTKVFPDTSLILMDTDHVKNNKEFLKLSDRIKNIGPAIILGTQMLSKGHDWPLITLCLLMIAPYELNTHLDERTAAMIVQVAGRAGRHEAGTVLIPIPHDEESPKKMTHLLSHDYQKFARDLLQERRVIGEYPFSSYLRFSLAHTDLATGRELLTKLKNQLESRSVFGPLFDYPLKRSHKWQLMLLARLPSKKHRHEFQKRALKIMESDKKFLNYVRLEVDPLLDF